MYAGDEGIGGIVALGEGQGVSDVDQGHLGGGVGRDVVINKGDGVLRLHLELICHLLRPRWIQVKLGRCWGKHVWSGVEARAREDSTKLPSGSAKFDRLASLPQTPRLVPNFAICSILRYKEKNERNILKDNSEDLEDYFYFLIVFPF
jgi:hypothetical protein